LIATCFFKRFSAVEGRRSRACGWRWSRAILVTSPVVLAELRRMPVHPGLRRFPRVTAEVVESFIGEIREVAVEVISPPPVFTYERDPKDSHYIDLAAAADASIVTSRDNDLMDLMKPGTPEADAFRRRFPMLRVLPPEVLLREVDAGG
jgi:putative PIN family toxin of toxin-antitoxin system